MNYMTPAELELYTNGKYLHAIKAVRERTGFPLRDCKQLVDDYGVALGYRTKTACYSCDGRGYTSMHSAKFVEEHPTAGHQTYP